MVLKQPRCHKPPEEVAAEKSLRQRRLATADCEMDVVCARELARDLVARVPAADDQHRPLRDVGWRAVVGAMDLKHVRGEVVGELGKSRPLERPGGDDDLVGLDRPVVEHELERVAVFVSERTALSSWTGSACA